jgi:diguanylate cyclase (GGDEF)-like protein/PAS domain S-box-containing protein
MNILAELSLVSAIMNLFLGVYALKKDISSYVHRTFSSLCFTIFFWSFMDYLILHASNINTVEIFYIIKIVLISSIGILILNFSFTLKGSIHLLKNKKLQLFFTLIVLFFIYGAVFEKLLYDSFYMSIYGWQRLNNIIGFWDIAFPGYIALSVIIATFILLKASVKIENSKQKKQTKFIALLLLFNMVICTFFEIITKDFLKLLLPVNVPVFMLFWGALMLYVILKYKFLTISPDLVAKNIVETITESIILIDNDCKIRYANEITYKITGLTEKEILEQDISIVYPDNKDIINNFYSAVCDNKLSNLETYIKTKNGFRIPVILSATESMDDNGNRIGAVIVCRDITELKNNKEKLYYLAHHDFLTKLPNRLHLKEKLKYTLLRAEKNNHKIAIMLLDLDRFKEINDVYGHNVGDALLKDVSSRLQSALYLTDTVARLGGDEFTVISTDFQNINDIETLAEKVLKLLSQPFTVDNQEIHISSSIGISIFPQDGENPDTLMKNADLAMYKAKRLGRNNFQFYSSSLGFDMLERLNTQNLIRKAIDNNHIEVYYQPLIDLVTGEVAGVEALSRIIIPEIGFIMPGKFIPIAEESHLIIEIGYKVLNNLCRDFSDNLQKYSPDFKVSINMSNNQFQNDDIVKNVSRILKKYNFPPDRLKIEITENTAINNIEKTISTLEKFKQLGIRVDIDDFGSGYSSFKYLKKLPIDSIKIDRYFISNILNSRDDSAIVKTMTSMASIMDLHIVLEGLEENEQLAYLKELLAKYINYGTKIYLQGFLFSKPVAFKSLAKIIKTHTKRAIG